MSNTKDILLPGDGKDHPTAQIPLIGPVLQEAQPADSAMDMAPPAPTSAVTAQHEVDFGSFSPPRYPPQ